MVIRKVWDAIFELCLRQISIDLGELYIYVDNFDAMDVIVSISINILSK